MQRQGVYPPPPGASKIPGLEVAGEIVSLGAGGNAWKNGDRVCALTNGGEYVNRNIQIAAMDGRLAIIAFFKGSKIEIDLMPMLLKRLVLNGSTLRTRSAKAKAAIAQNLKTTIRPLIENGTVKPKVFAAFPLQEAAKVHRLMESGRHSGKIILSI